MEALQAGESGDCRPAESPTANGQVGDARASQDRPHCLPLADPTLHRSESRNSLYVPTSRVLAVATEVGGTPYDIEGVEFSHEGDRCSFDTFLRIYDMKVPALDHLATIVRGADTSRHDLAPQCAGLFSISLGLSANFPNDHEMLEHGMVIYDALYTWCRQFAGGDPQLAGKGHRIGTRDELPRHADNLEWDEHGHSAHKLDFDALFGLGRRAGERRLRRRRSIGRRSMTHSAETPP